MKVTLTLHTSATYEESILKDLVDFLAEFTASYMTGYEIIVSGRDIE